MSEMVRPGSGAMFDRIAGRYDLLNRVLSFGLDRRWRRQALSKLLADVSPGGRVLDVATGTGDAALAIQKRRPDVEVVGLDPSSEMLAVAQQKRAADTVDWRLGQAEALPFETATFDACCIFFGIRNVEDRPGGLRELCRVLRPGGRLVVLELSEPPSGLLFAPARLYVHHVVPWLGGLLSGAAEYRYLQKSIAAFPPPEQFSAMLVDAGFVSPAISKRMMGVAHEYVADVR